MKAEKFNEALTEVGDRYIEEAEAYDKHEGAKEAAPVRKVPLMRRLRSIAAIAACFCLAVGGLAGITALLNRGAKSAASQFTYAYGGEDYMVDSYYQASGGAVPGAGITETAAASIGMNSNSYNYAEQEYPAPMTAEKAEAGSAIDAAKIIYTARISGETKDFDKAVDEINELVKAVGGYYEEQKVTDNSGLFRRADYTIRVPADQFESVCSGMKSAVQVTEFNTFAENITDTYYDTASRLRTAQIKLERLQDLLSRAEIMEDIITLEGAISDTEYEIERLNGTLRHYDALVGYSTVYVALREVVVYTEKEETPVTLGERMASAFKAAFRGLKNGTEDTIVWLVRNVFTLVILTAVIWTGAALYRKNRRKNR